MAASQEGLIDSRNYLTFSLQRRLDKRHCPGHRWAAEELLKGSNEVRGHDDLAENVRRHRNSLEVFESNYMHIHLLFI